MNLDDILGQLPIDQIAGQLGVDQQTARSAVDLALPALVGGLQANAQAPGQQLDLGASSGGGGDRGRRGSDLGQQHQGRFSHPEVGHHVAQGAGEPDQFLRRARPAPAWRRRRSCGWC